MKLKHCLLPLLSFLPLLAAAQQATTASLDVYKPASADGALRLLSQLFGSARGIFGNTDNPQIDSMFMAFNVAVMAVAALYFSYNMLAATVQGSYDGEFLGKRFSSVWMPIRTATGAALLVPAWKGWNLAQLIMAGAAATGIGIGNATWAGFQGQVISALVTPPATASLTDLAQPILAAETCLANHWADQARMKKANVDASAPEYQTNWDRQPVNGNGYAAIQYGAIPAINGYDSQACGIVTLQFPPISSADSDVQAVVTATRQAMSNALTGLDSDISNLMQPAKTMDPDDPDAVNTLEQTVKKALPSLVAAHQAQLNAQITAVTNARNAQVTTRVQQLTQQYGWIGAGAISVVALSNAVEVAQATPKIKVTAPQPDSEPPTIQAPAPSYLDSFNDANNDNQTAATAAIAQAPHQDNTCGLSSLRGTFINDCVEQPLIGKVKSSGLGGLVGSSNTDPLVFSQQLGLKILYLADSMLGWFFVFIFTIAALALGLSVASPFVVAASQFASAGITFFGFVLGVILIPLVCYAVQLAVYVPLIIPIAWIMAVGAWLVVIAESLIASTLWGLVHLDPEGEGMGQRTAHGWIFLLNLLFRPAILVFAVIFARSFCTVLGGVANSFVSSIIGKMMEANTSSLFVFLIMIAAGVWITTVLNVKIVSTGASLLHIIPNQIFTWIGGHFGSDVGSGVADNVHGEARGGISSAGGSLSRTAIAGADLGSAKAAKLGVDENEVGIQAAIQRQNWEAAAHERRSGGHGSIGSGATPDGRD